MYANTSSFWAKAEKMLAPAAFKVQRSDTMFLIGGIFLLMSGISSSESGMEASSSSISNSHWVFRGWETAAAPEWLLNPLSPFRLPKLVIAS